MAKSIHVDNKVLYPYPNVMVIERTYHFLEGYDANRDPVRLPKGTKLGWEYLGTVKDDHIKVGTIGFWTVRQIYVKKGHRIYSDK